MNFLFVQLLFAILIGVPSASCAAGKRDWGILVFPPLEEYNAFEFYFKWEKAYQAALDEAAALGMKRAVVTKTWREIEAKKGKEDFDSLAGAIAPITRKNISLFLGLQLINTVKREVPEDLEDAAWDSAEMMERAVSAVDRALALVPASETVYFSFGNEVDVYFTRHPSETEPYRRLFRHVRTHVRAKYPHVLSGITTTFDRLRQGETELITALNQDTDILIMTYYPLEGFQVRPPSSPHADFQKISAFAAGKPVVLQEAGYPSAEAAGSSETMQAEFIRALFEAWRENETIAHVNVFLQNDFSTTICDDLTRYYGFESAEYRELFRAFICTLGLKNAYGHPKQAWKALRESLSE